MFKMFVIKNKEMEIRQAVKSGRAVYDILNSKENQNGIKTAKALNWLKIEDTKGGK